MKDRYLELFFPKWLIRLGIGVLVGLAVVTTAMAGPKITGTASAWAYARDDSVEHVQVVPTVSFVARDCVRRDLHFEGSLRGYTDLRHDKSEDRQLRILRAVFVYEPQGKPYQVRLGQQWLSEGVGRGNVMGAWVKYRLNRITSVSGYFGMRVDPSLSVQYKNDLQGTAGGANLRTRFNGINLGVSYFGVAKSWELQYNGVGVDASGKPMKDLLLRGRVEAQVVDNEWVNWERVQLLAHWTPQDRVQVTAEFREQTPRIYEDSYFIDFLKEAYTTYARGAVRWTFYKMIYVKATGMTLLADYPDPLYKVRGALGHPNLEVGYTHWLSVAKGVMDGFYAQANYRLNEKYDLFGGYDFSTGSNADPDLRAATDSHAAYLGGSATPIPALTLTLRVEQVTSLNYDDDWRGLFGISTRFSNLR
ncbi:MAG: hypothetical protein ACOZB3_06305 [Calditrichota bacterium]